MATPTKMWTMDEQAALLAGVSKHNIGQWEMILADEEFAPRLANRSNVDLEDKWRKLCGKAARNIALPAPQSYEELRSWCNVMVLEALSSAKNPDGIDIDSLHSYIKQESDYATLPEIFRRFLKQELARLMIYGKIEKNGDLYKMKDDGPMDDHEINNGETSEDLALYAAHRIAVAENKRYKAMEACKKVEKIKKLLEESMGMLQMVEELREKCLRDGFVKLRVDSDKGHGLSGVSANNDDIPKKD